MDPNTQSILNENAVGLEKLQKKIDVVSIWMGELTQDQEKLTNSIINLDAISDQIDIEQADIGQSIEDLRADLDSLKLNFGITSFSSDDEFNQ